MALPADREVQTINSLQIVPFAHPQGCRGYLLADQSSKEALALDVHLDLVEEMARRVNSEGWELRYVVDSHTHADHPSGAGEMAGRFEGCKRMAHEKAHHAGVNIKAKDGQKIDLGRSQVTVRYAPGHTPDHMVLIGEGVLFSGDSLFIGSMARTDFLGGDAGELFDSIGMMLAELPDETIVFPGHDYQGRISSTLAEEKKSNPWLQITKREDFVEKLTANPPPKPANMDDLLRLNREGVDIPASISAAAAVRLVGAGGAVSLVDVRSGGEFDSEHIAGATLIPLDQIESRIDEVRARPAPRLLLCQRGQRAAAAQKILQKQHVGGLSIVEGGLAAYIEAGGETLKGSASISLERQVRITAGSLVLLGVLLSIFVHRGFLILSGFVGVGLIFAGISDFCGMAILLAKMPWNRSGRDQGQVAVGGTCAANLPGTCAANPLSGPKEDS